MKDREGDNLKESLEQEIKEMEKKMLAMDKDSMAYLLMELRTDIKWDNVKMMRKMDHTVETTGSLAREVAQLKSECNTLTTKLTYVSEVQEDEIVANDQVKGEV